MPYTIKNVPKRIKELPEEAKKIWISAYNSAYNQYSGDEEKCNSIAWAAVKKEYKKNNKGEWVKLSELMFCNEVEILKDKIQIMRTGTWSHPIYGDFTISEDDLYLFKENFDNKVRKTDIAIDTEHQPEKGAAAWIKHLSVEEGKLYAFVEWTEWGKELLNSKTFKYISPEFQFYYIDSETGEEFKNVLLGAALTNRPFLKNMEPVLFSEKILKQNGGSREMKKLFEKIGLSEKATEDEVIQKFSELEAQLKKIQEDLEQKAKENEELTAKLNESKKDNDSNIKLSEAEYMDLKNSAEMGKKALEQLKLSEVNNKIGKAIEEGKLLPSMKDWAVRYALNDEKGFESFLDCQPKIVKLDEKGSSNDNEKNITDAKDLENRIKLNDKVLKVQAEKKCSYYEALEIVKNGGAE